MHGTINIKYWNSLEKEQRKQRILERERQMTRIIEITANDQNLKNENAYLTTIYFVSY